MRFKKKSLPNLEFHVKLHLKTDIARIVKPMLIIILKNSTFDLHISNWWL